MPNHIKNVLLFAIALGLSACGTTRGSTDAVVPISPGERPEIHTDEAGLWMQFERGEEELRTSGNVITDPELNSYIKNIICKLEPEYCQDIRAYVVNAPGFNASMAPNGAMLIWTGMLLRVENEAQLANVLAHELAHYRQRHTLEQWRDLRDKMDGLVFFQLLVGAPFGLIAALVTQDSLYSFSRDQETEADDLGFDRLTAAGYDPREAPKMWAFLTAEEEASSRPKKRLFRSTHPQSETRRAALDQKVEALGDLPEKFELGQERFLAQTRRYRPIWLAQDIKAGDFGGSLAMLDRLLKREPEAGDLLFAKGEMLRRRGEDGDLDQAILAYKAAIAGRDYPPEAHRSLALVNWTQGQNDDAVAAFENYLIEKPDADDRLIIHSYIRQLK